MHKCIKDFAFALLIVQSFLRIPMDSIEPPKYRVVDDPVIVSSSPPSDEKGDSDPDLTVDVVLCACDDSTDVRAVAAAGAVGGAAAAPPVAVGILGGLGFGQGGVLAGSWAAATQAGIGNVVAGSPFAVAQSVGAGGALPFIGFAGAAVLGAAVVGGGYFAVKKIRERRVHEQDVTMVPCLKCGGLRALTEDERRAAEVRAEKLRLGPRRSVEDRLRLLCE